MFGSDDYSLENPDFSLIRRMISNDNLEGMNLLYDKYAALLLFMILRIVPDLERAEEILIDLIDKIWKDRRELPQSNDGFFVWLVAKTRDAIDRYFLS